MGFHWLQEQLSKGGSCLTNAEISTPAVPQELGNKQNHSVSLKKGLHTDYLTRDHSRLKIRF